MGLGLLPEDLYDLEERLVFKDAVVTFVCTAISEIPQKESISLTCKVLDGEHAGKFHTIFISLKRSHPILIRKLREFALAFFTVDEIKSGDQPLARLHMRKFSAVPQAPRDVGERVFQDFAGWKDLGEYSEDNDETAPTGQPTQPSSEVPF